MNDIQTLKVQASTIAQQLQQAEEQLQEVTETLRTLQEKRKLEAGLRGMLDTLANVGSPGSSVNTTASADGERLRTLKRLLEETIGSISSCLDSKLRLAQALGGSPPRKT